MPPKANGKFRGPAPSFYVGRSIEKPFDGVPYRGTVKEFEDELGFFVEYDDGDQEHLSLRDVKRYLLDDGGDRKAVVSPVPPKAEPSVQNSVDRKAKQNTPSGGGVKRSRKQAAEESTASVPAGGKQKPPAKKIRKDSVTVPLADAKEADAAALAGVEPEGECKFREEHGIKLGGVKRVHMPQPLAVMLRHHAVCKCWKCKAGIAPGKTKGGPRKGKESGLKGAKEDTSNPVKAAQVALRRAQRELDACKCSICKDMATLPLTTPCGHSFCGYCLRGHMDARQAAVQPSKSSRPSRRAATASTVLACPKCGDSIAQWFNSAPGVDSQLEAAGTRASRAVAEAEAQLATAQAAPPQVPSPVQSPVAVVEEEVAPDPAMESEFGSCEEESDLPEDAILVGEKCQGVDGKAMGKDWRQKCWYVTRQVGRVLLHPPFLDREAAEVPQWTCVFPEGSEAEERGRAEVKRASERFAQAYAESQEEIEVVYKAAGGVRSDGKKMSRRPDLAAQTKMREAGQFVGQAEPGVAPKPQPGTIPGIPVGSQFNSRAEMIVVGLHSHWLNGISCGKIASRAAVNGRPAKEDASYVTAICMSGGYEDDQDGGEHCKYTGEGGNDLLHDGRQIADQSWSRGNLALAHNCDLDIPARVIRKNNDASSWSRSIFTYDGLYRVQRYWREVGKSGYLTCKFQLERLAGQKAIESASVHWSNHMGSALPKNQRAEDRPGFIMADLSLGQEALPICVVNEMDTKSPSWAPDPLPLLPAVAPGKHPVEDAGWPADPAERERAFVYTTGQILSKNVPTPVPARELTDKELKELNQGALPYNASGDLHKQEFCVFEQAPQAEPVLGPSCSAQLGIRYRLELFRTVAKGWGVRSWDRIPAGAFVCEFAGEILTEEDTLRVAAHDEDYNEYMFDLTIHGLPLYEHATGQPLPNAQHDFSAHQDESRRGDKEKDRQAAQRLMANANLKDEDVQQVLHLDGKRAGSIGRFINHNHRTPNLTIQMGLWDHHDPRMVRLCFFATENIPPLTELTYDYGVDYEKNMLNNASLSSLKVGSR